MFLETSQNSLNPSPYTDKHQYQHQFSTNMATDLAMPVQQFNVSPTQYNLYATQGQQISPVNSATGTPNNISPTSPRIGGPPYMPQGVGQQLRTPRSPLYIPAVLRPTDAPRRATKPSPLTPPHSKQNSFDDLDSVQSLSRRSTGDSGKFGIGAITEAEWSCEGLGKVTAPPTREHWKADHESSLCDEATCTRYFTYFTRRHHCRRCGNIFCDEHSSRAIPLDQDANYHPQGMRSRACSHCFNEFSAWQLARFSRSNDDGVEAVLEAPGTPTVNCAVNKGLRGAMGNVFGPKTPGTPESLAQSVPRDWHWSTF